jgi:hypothetical protein
MRATIQDGPKLTAQEPGQPAGRAKIKITGCDGKKSKQTSNFKCDF